jgi:hypothetical protein
MQKRKIIVLNIKSQFVELAKLLKFKNKAALEREFSVLDRFKVKQRTSLSFIKLKV